ncbi:MAG: hypothetical protein JW828_12205 [Sedimentisphaerales bacterium]|nr:hypothetical protein [Sedimentisphaerales bacterium]
MNQPDRWVYSFSEPGPTEDPEQLRCLFGERGIGLTRLATAGLAVPPGFMITTEACRYFLEQGGKWPAELSKQIQTHLRRLEKETQSKLGKGRPPLLVSISSGPTGQEYTLSGCGLGPELASLMREDKGFWIAYVRFIRAFAELVQGLTDADFDEAGLGEEASETAGQNSTKQYLAFYKKRTHHTFPARPFDQLKQCIIAMFRTSDSESSGGAATYVQQMLSPQVSGSVFTLDPADAFAEQMRIECLYGSPGTDDSGDAEPDRFSVNRERLSMSARFLSDEGTVAEGAFRNPILTEGQVRQLARQALKAEEIFGCPIELKFGLVEGGFVFFQAQKIEDLESAREMEAARRQEAERIEKLMAKEKGQTWILSDLDEELPYPTPLAWDLVHRFIRSKGGLERMVRMLGYRPSRRRNQKGFLELLGGRIYSNPDRLAGLFGKNLPFGYDMEEVIHDRGVLNRAPDRWDPKRIGWMFFFRLPGILWRRRRISHAIKRLRKGAKQRFDHEVLPVFLTWIDKKKRQDLSRMNEVELLSELEDRCRMMLEEFGPEFLLPAYLGQAVSASLQKWLVQLMGPQHGRVFSAMLTEGLDGNMALSQECGQRRQQAQEDLHSHLQRWGGTVFRESIECDLADAQTLLSYYKAGRHYWRMGYETIRIVLDELSRRWGLGEGITYLRQEELCGFIEHREDRIDLIRRRRIRRAALQHMAMPAVIDATRPFRLDQDRIEKKGKRCR